MPTGTVILNERDAKDARAELARLDHALSSDEAFRPIIDGLPHQIISRYRRSIEVHRAEIETTLAAYEAAKSGDFSGLWKSVGSDPGLALIVARIARGLSQKDLARQLGQREQQVQRYEADKYRSISLGNFVKVAKVLGVNWNLTLPTGEAWLPTGQALSLDVNAADIKKVVRHAKERGWFEEGDDSSFEESFSNLKRYISDHSSSYGSPALLRTGLKAEIVPRDLLLLAWKARISRVAEVVIEHSSPKFQSLGIGWLRDLTRLSRYKDGPKRAKEFLLSKGIVLVVEPQIPGLKIDGAAFLVADVPVVGLTIRRDTIDSFWFTLMHEVAHVVLHSRADLLSGFFDDIEFDDLDDVESEADEFASNLLIPDEIWATSTVRLSKSVAAIKEFAEEVGVHPAIVFGRIRKERGNYSIFSDQIGQGAVRKQFLTQEGSEA